MLEIPSLIFLGFYSVALEGSPGLSILCIGEKPVNLSLRKCEYGIAASGTFYLNVPHTLEQTSNWYRSVNQLAVSLVIWGLWKGEIWGTPFVEMRGKGGDMLRGSRVLCLERRSFGGSVSLSHKSRLGPRTGFLCWTSHASHCPSYPPMLRNIARKVLPLCSIAFSSQLYWL